MKKYHSFIDTVDQIVSDGVKRKILHLSTQDEQLCGNLMTIKGRQVINFGSCSYLGLEFDLRMIKSAKTAVDNFGTQFSESRAYISLGLYDKLESKFEKVFGSPVIVTPTTTLGHIACIPVIVNENDAVILDHQVHNSVQTAVKIVKSNGVHTELLRHNRMDLLEERIKELRQKHRKIWYMADGIYSMFGDACPTEEIQRLLEKYPEFHFYVDDAHGMSCYGENGRGYILSKMKIHERMVLATSLAKGFATGGAVLVFPNKEMTRRVRTCGGPMITSGPIQPATLGAAIASADIHLSKEIEEMQTELHDKIKYTWFHLKKLQMPVISNGKSPVFFIGVSLPKIGYKIIERMLEKGYYLNLGIFPAVPMKNTGIRFTITRLHSFNQIDNMIKELKFQLDLALKEENFDLSSIYKAFKIDLTNNKLPENTIVKQTDHTDIIVKTYSSINQIKKENWNSLMGSKGNFDHSGMQFLEKTFSGNELPEDNWKFRYLIILDRDHIPVLATFFTVALWKNDMLSANEISQMIEEKRKENPYFMTSEVLMAGSLFTEGEHLFIDKKSPYINEALKSFFQIVQDLQDEFNVANTLIRDFHFPDPELDTIFIENGFFKLNMPDSHILELDNNNPEISFESNLSPRSRKHLRQDILKHEDKYCFAIENNPAEKDVEHWYKLYLNVKNRSFELNTFTLPYKLFSEMAKDPNWQISTLRLKKDFNPISPELPVAVMFTYLSEGTANFMLIGIDYSFQREFHCYRQALYKVITHNLRNGIQKINLGFAASFEKKKLGASIIPTCAYMQMKDNYEMQAIEEMKGFTLQKQLV